MLPCVCNELNRADILNELVLVQVYSELEYLCRSCAATGTEGSSPHTAPLPLFFLSQKQGYSPCIFPFRLSACPLYFQSRSPLSLQHIWETIEVEQDALVVIAPLLSRRRLSGSVVSLRAKQ